MCMRAIVSVFVCLAWMFEPMELCMHVYVCVLVCVRVCAQRAPCRGAFQQKVCAHVRVSIAVRVRTCLCVYI